MQCGAGCRVTQPLMLRLCLALFALCTSLSAAQPNFVWIIADDMSPDIAAYGAKGVKTPHLDRLAAEGRRYARAYSTAPVCSSSRSAFILGCYQTTTGLHPHDTEKPQPLAAPYVPLPNLLQKAGYFVTNAPAPDTIRSVRRSRRAKRTTTSRTTPKRSSMAMTGGSGNPGSRSSRSFRSASLIGRSPCRRRLMKRR